MEPNQDPYEAAAMQVLSQGSQAQADPYEAAATQVLSQQQPASTQQQPASTQQQQQVQSPRRDIFSPDGAEAAANPPTQGHDKQLMGNIQKWATGLPIVGEPIANIGRAFQEANTKGNLGTAMAASAAGALEGAGRSVEEPIAAGYGLARMAIPQLPPELNVMGKYHDLPAVKELSKNAPGSYETGNLAGNLGASALEGGAIGMAGKKVLSKVLTKLAEVAPKAAEAAQQVIQKSEQFGQPPAGASSGRKLTDLAKREGKDIAGSATAGAGFGAAQGAGRRVMEGGKPEVTAQDLEQGALGGAVMHYPAKVVGNLFKRDEKAPSAKPTAPTSKDIELQHPSKTQVFAKKLPARVNESREVGFSSEPPIDVSYEPVQQPTRELPGPTHEGPPRIESDDERYVRTLRETGRYPSGLRDTSYIPMQGKTRGDVTPEQVSRAEEVRSAGAPGAGTKKLSGIVKPEPMAEEPRKISEIKQPEPEPIPTFKSVEEATHTFLNSKNQAQIDAAQQYIEQQFSKNKQAEPELKEETPTMAPEQKPLQGHVEESVNEPEPEDQLGEHEKKFYEATGLKPVKEPETSFHERMKVPAEEIAVKDPTTGRYTGSFDETDTEPKLVKWRGDIYAAEPHPNEPGHVTVGQKVGYKGTKRAEEALDAMRRGTAASQQLRDAPIGFSPAQEYANKRNLEEGAAGKTRDEQLRAHQDAANINAKRRLTTLHGGAGFQALEMVPELPGMAKRGISNIIKSPLVQGAKEMMDTRDTMDKIQDGAARNKSDFHERLNDVIARNALSMHGENVTTGESGAAVRAAQYQPINDIMNPAETPDLTPEQRIQASRIRHNADEVATMVRREIKDHSDDAEYTGVLRELLGTRKDEGGADSGFRKISGHLFKYTLARNPAFAGNMALHPAQLGSAEVGFRNIADAYEMAHRDPVVKNFIEKMSGTFTDPHAVHSEASAIREGQPLPERWKIEKVQDHNNAIVTLGGMTRQAKAMYGENWKQSIHDLMTRADEGEAPTNEDIQIFGKGLEALHNTTSNVPGVKNKAFTSRNEVYRFLAQLSGYRGLTTRLMMRTVGDMKRAAASKDPALAKAAARKLATFYGATLMMGGGSVAVPQEAREAMWRLNPQGMYTTEWLLDHANVVGGLTHRALADHIRPGFVNWGYSAPLERGEQINGAMQRQWKESEGKDPFHKALDMVGQAMWQAPVVPSVGGSTIGGVGAGVVKKSLSNLKNSAGGKKDIYEYVDGRFAGKGERSYSAIDAAADTLLPGEDINAYNWKHRKFVEKMFKDAHLQPPRSLKDDYPVNIGNLNGEDYIHDAK